jgi:hypothetical protein
VKEILPLTPALCPPLGAKALMWILSRLRPDPSTACLSYNVFAVGTCVMAKIFKARTEGALCSGLERI